MPGMAPTGVAMNWLNDMLQSDPDPVETREWVDSIKAVIDANQGKPRIVYYRDLTDLGRSLDPRNLGR